MKRISMNIENEKIDEICKKVYFISSDIINYETKKGNLTSELILELNDNADESKVINYIKSLMGYIPYNCENAQENIVWISREKKIKRMVDDEALFEKGIIHKSSLGRIALGEPLISIYNYLDSRILNFCKTQLNAVEFMYPTFIKNETIQKCGYIDNSCNYLFFVQKFKNDFKNYVDFLEEYKTNKLVKSSLKAKHLDDCEYCLPPTMCYHIYDQFEGEVLPLNYVITAKGKAFRNEDKYATSLERLWDFTIRETAFFGDYDFVKNIRNQFASFMYDLLDELELVGRAVPGNDPFFLDPKAKHKIQYQKKLATKIELVVDISENKSIAVASFNYHDNFFMKNFKLKCMDSGNCVSGCTGVGLERLSYAFICRHGMDPRNWPISV